MNNPKLKVGIYLRLSDEDKNKKTNNSESIKNQRHLLLEEIKKREDFILVDEYCDEDLSGAGTYRPEFERLIKDCEAKKIDIVLCKSQSRFSRDMEIIEKYLHNKFIEWNIRFISLADNADTSNTGNKKSRQINGLVNEWYLEDVSNNIRSAFIAKMKQGELISPFAPYGYEINPNNNNQLIIDPNASLIVKKIFNLYLKGLGLTSIANYLNTNNIPSPSHYKYQKGIKLNITSNKPRNKIKWSPNTIKTILTNETYIGNLIQGKRTTISYKNHKIIKKDKSEWIKYQNTHSPIIDKNIYTKVQNLIKERTKPTKKGTIHIFSGKVHCLECNQYMRKKNSTKHEYLVCTNNKNCPNKSSIRYDQLEEIILKEINKLITKYYNINIIEKELTNKQVNTYINKIKILEKQKQSLKTLILQNEIYLKNIYEDKINNIITINQFKTLSKTYNKKEKTYNQELKLLTKEIKLYQHKDQTLINLKKILNKYQSLKELNIITTNEFIKKISIGKVNNDTRTIQIEYNF